MKFGRRKNTTPTDHQYSMFAERDMTTISLAELGQQKFQPFKKIVNAYKAMAISPRANPQKQTPFTKRKKHIVNVTQNFPTSLETSSLVSASPRGGISARMGIVSSETTNISDQMQGAAGETSRNHAANLTSGSLTEETEAEQAYTKRLQQSMRMAAMPQDKLGDPCFFQFENYKQTLQFRHQSAYGHRIKSNRRIGNVGRYVDEHKSALDRNLQNNVSDVRDQKLKESNSKTLRNVKQRSIRQPQQTIEFVDQDPKDRLQNTQTSHQLQSLNQDLSNNLSLEESQGAHAVRTPRGNIRIRPMRPMRAQTGHRNRYSNKKCQSSATLEAARAVATMPMQTNMFHQQAADTADNSIAILQLETQQSSQEKQLKERRGTLQSLMSLPQTNSAHQHENNSLFGSSRLQNEQMSPTTLDDLKREFGRGSTQERKNPSKLSDMIMNDMRKVHGIYSGESGSVFNKKASVKPEISKYHTFTSQKRSQASQGAIAKFQNVKMNSLMLSGGAEESATQTLKTPKSPKQNRIQPPKAVSSSLFSSTMNQKSSTIGAYSSSIQKKQNVDYKAKLSYVSPAATIEGVKKNIKQVIRQNIDLKDKIEDQVDRTFKKRELIAELDYETKKAMNDRDGIFRDLSTFESNFVKSENERIKNEIENVTQLIHEKVTILKESEDQQDYYEKYEEHTHQIHKLGQSIQDLVTQNDLRRREQGSMYSLVPDGYDPLGLKNQVKFGVMNRLFKRVSTFTMKSKQESKIGVSAASSPDQSTVGTKVLQKQSDSFIGGPSNLTPPLEVDEDSSFRNRAQVAMTMLLFFKEQIDTQIMIGGIMCNVQASYINGQVTGYANSAISNKKHTFEFEPLNYLKKKLLIIAEIKRLYWEYFPEMGRVRHPQGITGVVLMVKKEHECDPFDFNFLDKELIYMAQIEGSRQKYIKMILTRTKIEDFKSERLSDSSTDNKKKGTNKSKKTKPNSVGSSPQSKANSKNKLNQTMKSSECDINDNYDSENEESEYDDCDDDLSSELCEDPEKDYCIEPSNLYIDCKVFMPGKQPLKMDIELDHYPKLKPELSDVFNLNKGLVDLARELEKDLLIYEHEPNNFKLVYKQKFMQSIELSKQAKAQVNPMMVRINDLNNVLEKHTTQNEQTKESQLLYTPKLGQEVQTDEQQITDHLSEATNVFQPPESKLSSQKEVLNVDSKSMAALKSPMVQVEASSEKKRVQFNNSGATLPLNQISAVQSYENFSEVKVNKGVLSSSFDATIEDEEDSSEEEDQLEKYDFQYKVRQQNPDRFRQSQNQFNSYINMYSKQKSNRSQSQRSHHKGSARTQQKVFPNEKDFYDCAKGALSYGYLNKLYQEEEYVDQRICYSMEDFGYSAPIRMNHKPEKPEAVNLIFFQCRGKGGKDFANMNVIFGIEDESRADEEQSPEKQSTYNNIMTFDIKMVKEFTYGAIDSLYQLFNEVPFFCENLRFKKIIWDEVNSYFQHKRQKMNALKRINQTDVEQQNTPSSLKEDDKVISQQDSAENEAQLYMKSEERDAPPNKLSDLQIINDDQMTLGKQSDHGEARDEGNISKTPQHRSVAQRKSEIIPLDSQPLFNQQQREQLKVRQLASMTPTEILMNPGKVSSNVPLNSASACDVKIDQQAVDSRNNSSPHEQNSSPCISAMLMNIKKQPTTPNVIPEEIHDVVGDELLDVNIPDVEKLEKA